MTDYSKGGIRFLSQLPVAPLTFISKHTRPLLTPQLARAPDHRYAKPSIVSGQPLLRSRATLKWRSQLSVEKKAWSWLMFYRSQERNRHRLLKLSFPRVLIRSTQANTLWGQVHEKLAILSFSRTGLHRIKAAPSHRKWSSSPGWCPRTTIRRDFRILLKCLLWGCTFARETVHTLSSFKGFQNWGRGGSQSLLPLISTVSPCTNSVQEPDSCCTN